MTLFKEWWEEYGRHYKIEFFESITGDAYRAGMLAAADLAEKLGDQWTEADYHKYGEMTPSRATGAEAIEFEIREAAK